MKLQVLFPISGSTSARSALMRRVLLRRSCSTAAPVRKEVINKRGSRKVVASQRSTLVLEIIHIAKATAGKTGETLMKMTAVIPLLGAMAVRHLLPGTGLGRMTMTLAILVDFNGGRSLGRPNQGNGFGMKVMWMRKTNLVVMI